jgi:membrane-associated PAP2 superfamily phosphatase
MTLARLPYPSRPFSFRLALGIPLTVMLMMLLRDPTAIDFSIARMFYVPGTGFIGRKSFWLEDILHDRAKQAVIIVSILFIGAFLLSFFVRGLKEYRRALGCVVLSMAITTSIVSPLKALTAVHCPWSLSEFGGSETYTPLLSERAPALKPGLCWPGGHASTGFSLLALFFALRDRQPKAARIALAIALCLGSLFSVGRMLQGAHFLSHNIWTLLLDWVICVLCYRWVLYRPQPVMADSAGAAEFPARMRGDNGHA